MALLTLPRDLVPSWAKIDLQLHRPVRAWFGFGRLRCDWCGERWGRHGCPMRESAARLFVYTASPAQRQAALDSGDLAETDLRLRRSRPAGHRRKPRPYREHGTPGHCPAPAFAQAG
ncbi:hypothetical protein LO763_08750 [Glycomyces sp. A-F 0318]|uniref:hypothetical protein n=1 Tax=Glycomyces amatae TaxID=2881355 RepID=UPI001E32E34C|nr:hypothetical protein [Glycomyces amatae]MCD0443708.1 hypothetical protein [Glycomyces amatae]